MRMTLLGLATLCLALAAGCADSADDAKPPTGDPAVSEASPPSADGQPSRVDAEALLTSTLEKAKSTDKRVLVHLGAPWCGWCKELEKFLAANAALFVDDYLLLKIDVEEMEHGEEVAKRLRGDRTGGIPWITILDANGTELVTSDGPDGNIGCPIAEPEQAHFMAMIEKTIQHAPDGRVAEIAAALAAFAASKL